MPSHPAGSAAIVFVLLASADASAQDTTSAEQAGMGGTAVADPRDNAGVTNNPALISLFSRYDVQALFRGGPTKDLRWGGSAVDGRTSEHLSFGLAYNGGITTTPFHPSELPGWAPVQDDPLEKKLQSHDITFALAAPFLERKLSIGVNGTLSIQKGDWIASKVTGNLTAGIAAHPIEYLTVGFVGRNLLPIDGQADTPATLALGVRGGKEDLIEGSIDVSYQVEQQLQTPWRVAAGVEGSIKFVRLRAGYDWNGDRDAPHRLSWGLGAFTKVGSLDYAMQIPIATKDFVFADVIHTLSITIRTNFGDKKAEQTPIQWKDGGLRRH